MLFSTALATEWVFVFHRNPTNRWDQGGRLRDGFRFLAYGIARVVIFVEIFLYLRAAPVGVYLEIEWELYVPHL